MTNPAWDDTRTARLYDEFTQEFPMYDTTSRDLVGLAGTANAATIVDLACGTGVTTRAILDLARPDASVVAIDGSKAMLDVARERVLDDRVRFVLDDAAALADHAADIDAIICNSAIWQLDMAAVFAAAACALRPGGRFVFNIGRQFIMLPFTEEETSSKPSLFEYAQAFAILDYDYVQPLGAKRRRLLSQDIVDEMLTAAGLRLETFEILIHSATPEQDAAWLKIPIFADNILYGLPYDRQAEIIDKAYARVDNSTISSTRWACFVAGTNRNEC